MELLGVVPADAIALRLYSLPAAASTVASLCAWIVAALAAAAVGLWRIRAVGSSNKPPAGVRSALADDDTQRLPSPAIDETRAEQAEPASPCASEPTTPSKVRFTAYYGAPGAGGGYDGVRDGVRKCADRDKHDGGGLLSDVDAESEPATLLRRTASVRRSTPLTAAPSWEEREMAVRRRGDLGWYRHLDMAALDGSVVRLWDGGAVAASSRARRARIGLELHLSL